MTASAGVPAQGLSWYETTVATQRERTRLTFDLDVDVCVIGGGLAGLTVARELARRDWSVAVLEAYSVGWNASGRNCGFVLPGFAEKITTIAERVGLSSARAMWQLADAGLVYVRDTITETEMPGVDPVYGWLQVNKFGEDYDLPDHADDLSSRFGAEVEVWSVEHMRETLRSPLYFNALYWPTAFHIHPLNYTLGLAAAAEAAGVRIFEETPALAFDPAGIRKRVTTPSARVRAAQIVLAGNVHLGPLLPQFSGTLMPVTTFVAVTAPVGDRLHEIIDYSGAVSDGERADNHYRIVGGDRLLWGGGMRTWNADPRRFAGRLRADIARVYPQLADIAIAHVWSGTLGRTVHRMPQIGELAPGLWAASGFGGHGLNTTAMAGLMIARAITENDTSWRLFQPYELVWAGGTPGRMVVQASYGASRLRDRTQAFLTRWRPGGGWSKVIASVARASSDSESARAAQLAKAADPAAAAAAAAAVAAVMAESVADGDVTPSERHPQRRLRRSSKKAPVLENAGTAEHVEQSAGDKSN